ncbi:YoaK family protein [Kitasatospora sp. NPDC004240]
MQPKTGTVLTATMVLLTLTTGVVEAVSLLALGHVFTAMMTGNLLFLAFGLAGAGAGQLSVAASSVSLGAFAAGVLTGGLLERWVNARHRRWFVTGLLVEAALVAAAGLIALPLPAGPAPLTGRHYAVVALVALAMGLRSVTTLRAHVPDLPTTLATRTFTALLNDLGGHRNVPRRVAAVLAMFLGGLAGAALLVHHIRPAPLLLAVAAAVLLAALAQTRTPAPVTP